MNTISVKPGMIAVLLKRDLHFILYSVIPLVVLWINGLTGALFVVTTIFVVSLTTRFTVFKLHAHQFLFPHYKKAEYLVFSFEFGLLLLIVAVRFFLSDPRYVIPATSFFLIIAAATMFSDSRFVSCLSFLRKIKSFPVLVLCVLAAIFFSYYVNMALVDLAVTVPFYLSIVAWEFVTETWSLVKESYWLQIAFLLFALSLYSVLQVLLVRSFKTHKDYHRDESLDAFGRKLPKRRRANYAINAPQSLLFELNLVARIQQILFWFSSLFVRKNARNAINHGLDYVLFSRAKAGFFSIDIMFFTIAFLVSLVKFAVKPDEPYIGPSIVILLIYSYFRCVLMSVELLDCRDRLPQLNLMSAKMGRLTFYRTVGFLFVTSLSLPAIMLYLLELLLAKISGDAGIVFYPFINVTLVINLFSAAGGLFIARISRRKSRLLRSLHILLHFIVSVVYMFMAFYYHVPYVVAISTTVLVVIVINEWWARGAYQHS